MVYHNNQGPVKWNVQHAGPFYHISTKILLALYFIKLVTTKDMRKKLFIFNYHYIGMVWIVPMAHTFFYKVRKINSAHCFIVITVCYLSWVFQFCTSLDCHRSLQTLWKDIIDGFIIGSKRVMVYLMKWTDRIILILSKTAWRAGVLR